MKMPIMEMPIVEINGHKRAFLVACAVSLAGTVLAGGWEPPRTTRRYVHPPLAERMFVLWNDAKISFAEVAHEKDWSKIEYRDQVGDVCWFFRGADDGLFDFRQAKNLVPEDGTPLQGLEWSDKDVTVTLETCCDTVRACTCFGRFSVRNDRSTPYREEFAVRLRHGREVKMLGDHPLRAPDFYSPFESHPEKLDETPCDWSLRGSELRSASGGFMTFSQMPEASRWDAEKGEFHFAVEVPSGKTVSFDFALGYGASVRANYAPIAKATVAWWRRELAKINRLPAGVRDNPRYRRIVSNLTVQMLQCFCRPVGRDYVLPRQGGLQRWVWPWDNMEALEALVRIGDYADYVKGAIDFYFGLYGDGGYSEPEFQGRIGPFGNDWDCNTANVIGILGRYCVDANDPETWKRYRADALRGFRWVMGRRVKPDNADGLVPGLFPPGQASDYKAAAQTWGFTDAVNVQSLGNYLEAAERFGDPDVAEIRRGVEDYVGTIRDLVDKFRRKCAGSDFFELPITPDGKPVPKGFPKAFHSAYLVAVGLRYGFLDATDIDRIWRQCIACGNASPNGLSANFPCEDLTSSHYWYTTALDLQWHRSFLRIGNRAQAKKIFDATLKYAMSKEMQVGERYRDDNPWYLPWCPNCSGSGRIVKMLLDWEGNR